MSSKRILVTGISTYWGGQLARRLESDPEVETVIGVDRDEPRVELERTEFVRVGHQHRLLRRIVDAAAIDTVVDTRLIVDSANASPRAPTRTTCIGTMNILAACSGARLAGPQVRLQVLRALLRLRAGRPGLLHRGGRAARTRPRTLLEKDIVEAERAVAEFASRSTPMRRWRSSASPTRSAPDLETSHSRLFALPAVPTILGFDPRYQFIHEDDIVGVLEHAVRNDLPGVYNAAADGVLVLSEILDLLGKRMAPLILPPWGTDLVAGQVLKRLGVRADRPRCSRQLRFGRGLDNRKLKAAGYEYRYTTREAVIKLARAPAHRAPSPTAATPATSTSATSRSSCAGARACRPAAARPGPARPRTARPAPSPLLRRRWTTTRSSSIVASLGRDELEELRALRGRGPRAPHGAGRDRPAAGPPGLTRAAPKAPGAAKKPLHRWPGRRRSP